MFKNIYSHPVSAKRALTLNNRGIVLRRDTLLVIYGCKVQRSSKKQVKVINKGHFVWAHKAEGSTTPASTGYTTCATKQVIL